MRAEELKRTVRHRGDLRGLAQNEVRFWYSAVSHPCAIRVRWSMEMDEDMNHPDWMSFANAGERIYLIPAGAGQNGFKVTRKGVNIINCGAYMPLRTLPDGVTTKMVIGRCQAHKDPECGYYYVNFSEVRE